MTLRELSQLYWLRKEVALDERRMKALEDKPELAEVKAEIEKKYVRIKAEWMRLEQYIANVDDSYMRQILTLRYVYGYSWHKVALRIGGGNTADGIKKRCQRYISKK